MIQEIRTDPAFQKDFSFAWPYSQDAVDSFFKGKLVEGGGKALGLKLCEELAQHLPSSPFSVSVPEWQVVSHDWFYNRDTQIDRLAYGHIFRSSAKDEDWLNPASGMHKSFVVEDMLDLVSINREDLTSQHYIKQKYRNGYGLVVDVAYSNLAGEVLVKIASGLKRFVADDLNRPYYTSATSDSEASVKVYCPNRKTLSCQSLNLTKDSAFSMFEDSSWQDFAGQLVTALQKMKTNFAVQLEFIVEPNCSGNFALVQIRPSPAAMVCANEFAKLESPIFYDSGIFNKPGEKGFQRAEIIDKASSSTYIFEPSWEREDPVAILDPEQIAAHEMKSEAAAQAYAALMNRGFSVILTPFALNPSFKHDKADDRHSDKLFNQLSSHCHLVHLPASQISALIAAYKQGYDQIAVQIDGMLARVYQQRS